MSSTVVLSPPEYKCPEHDNQAEITKRVKATVEDEFSTFDSVARSSSPFEVVIECPGNVANKAKDTSHLWTFTGTRQVLK